MQNPTLLKGYAYALITILIWTGWIIISRLGATHNLTPMDMAFFRHGPAGLILLPVAFKNRRLITRENYKGIIVMLVGAGPLYLLCTSNGFMRAPAAHGVLTPCVMSLFVAILTYFFLREKITRIRYIGYGLILTGVAFKFYISGGDIADFYFLAAGFLWAVYTVQNKKLGLPPVAVAAFICTGSMLVLLIPYSLSLYIYPHPLPIVPLIQQIVYQGILTAIISFITYNRAVALIGAGRASSLAALVPVLVILLAIPILNEKPDVYDMIFAAFMSAGVFLASGVLRLAGNKVLKDA